MNETEESEKSRQPEQIPQKEKRPTPKEESLKEFEEYLMNIGIRI